MLRKLFILDELADEGVGVAIRARLPERGERRRVLEGLISERQRDGRDEGSEKTTRHRGCTFSFPDPPPPRVNLSSDELRR